MRAAIALYAVRVSGVSVDAASVPPGCIRNSDATANIDGIPFRIGRRVQRIAFRSCNLDAIVSSVQCCFTNNQVPNRPLSVRDPRPAQVRTIVSLRSADLQRLEILDQV